MTVERQGMITELKPCPFCGGEARAMGKGSGFVYCECGGEMRARGDGNNIYDDDQAITAWNTRAADPERKRLVEALERARKAIASLPEDALGMVRMHPASDGDDGYSYPIRDELLHDIDNALGPDFCRAYEVSQQRDATQEEKRDG